MAARDCHCNEPPAGSLESPLQLAPGSGEQLPPNAPDQLPVRLEGLQSTQNQTAGPDNGMWLFGPANLRCPLFRLSLIGWRSEPGEQVSAGIDQLSRRFQR
jgi:hypothetical protein